jgi:DNA topoisomerase-1
VKWAKVNATLPKESDPQTVTLEEALPLIAAKAAKGGKKAAPKKAAAKKPAAKKSATKAASKATTKKPAARKAAAKPKGAASE